MKQMASCLVLYVLKWRCQPHDLWQSMLAKLRALPFAMLWLVPIRYVELDPGMRAEMYFRPPT